MRIFLFEKEKGVLLRRNLIVKVINMESNDKTPATPEIVWEAFREAEKRNKEREARFDRELEKSRAESAKRNAESEAKFDRQMDKLSLKIAEVNDTVNGIGKSNGMFAEEFFFNTIENGDKKLFGEQFSECYASSKKYIKENRTRTENDILLVNGKTVAFVEVKYRARRDDVEKIINKLPKIRATYPDYRSHGIYLGLAAMSFEDDVETEAGNNGIAVIKQVGDKIIVKDEHVQMF
jgi:hypothetical protein